MSFGERYMTHAGSHPDEGKEATREDPYWQKEREDVLQRFGDELRKATGDGSKKRQSGSKPPWYLDEEHEGSAFSHITKWKRGELVDPDSGAHPLVHAAWRLLAIACTENGNNPDAEEDLTSEEAHAFQANPKVQTFYASLSSLSYEALDTNEKRRLRIQELENELAEERAKRADAEEEIRVLKYQQAVRDLKVELGEIRGGGNGYGAE